MTPERWHRITGIFHRALTREPAERTAFVASECRADESLRRAVDAMLEAHDAAGDFGRTAAFLAGLGREPEDGADAGLTGTRFGRYEIGPILGAGGMGAVYRATDTRLHRDVALKVLLPAVASDPDRLARLAREAHTLAALNHPNIAQVYDLEEIAGVRAVIMELVEGPTLADRIADGPIAIEEALAIAQQIAAALEASHAQNIIHRDLKPSNVSLRPDGTVKVLDFGLSKALDDHEDVDTPRGTAAAADVTATGIVLGTAAYMSPEQAQGRPIDSRTDIWSFGCVLFELLSGQPAFAGISVPDVLARVVHGEPDRAALPRATPAPIRMLLDRCLQKDPHRRAVSAAGARAVIDGVLARAARRRSWRRTIPWASAGAAAMALIVAALFRSSDGVEMPAPVPRLQNAKQVTFALDVESYPAWSPDGTRLAYQASDVGWYFVGNHDIWVTAVAGGEPVNLTADSPANDRMPSWSPNGGEIAFFSDRNGSWGVYLVSPSGGVPRRILDLPTVGNMSWSAPQWSSDGRLFVSVREGGENTVIALNLASLAARRIALPRHDGNVCFDLTVSPDGRHFAYVEGGSGETEVTRLWTIAADGSNPVPLTDGRTNVWSPTWSRDGRHLFYVSNREGAMDLWQQELVRGSPVGVPLRITQGLGIRSATFSADGRRLAYTRGGRISNVWRAPITSDRPATWADAIQLTAERAFVEFVDVSPNGEQLALSSDRRGNQDLWVIPAAGGMMRSVTADLTPDWAPRWSPSGRDIAFYSYRTGNRDVWVVPAEGGSPRQLTAHPAQDRNPRWSPDGLQMLFHSSRPEGHGWWVASAAGGGERLLMTSGDAGDDGGDWAPDGRSLVLSKGGRLYRATIEGGETVLPPTVERPFSPRFSRDARAIYYCVVTGPPERHGLWRLSLSDWSNTPLTRLEGRRGRLGYIFSAGPRDVYFTWGEDDGDIWMMDVLRDPAT